MDPATLRVDSRVSPATSAGSGWSAIAVMGPDAWIWMLVWVGALLAMVWLLVRPADRSREPDAMAILRARYARGELTEAEFDHARRVLRDEREFQR